MHSIQRLSILAVIATLTMSVALSAQTAGPDVIVGDITGIQNYGSSGSVAAFSVGTTSCNIGNQNLSWISNTNQHPVIGQQLYRLKDGKLEQIGMNWLKHGFTALDQSLCDTCNPTGGNSLGVGCSDPYGSSLNGQQGPLGPRSEVNAATGYFPYPVIFGPPYNPTIGRRLQAAHADLDPALNVGALYFVEAHYVTPDDAASGNAANNASYREVSVSPSSGSYTLSYVGTTQRTQPAIEAWRNVDPSVAIVPIDVPGDGRINVAIKTTDLGNGTFRHVYAVHNLNSDRCVGSVSVALPAGAVVTNTNFHDVPYHSGEVFVGGAWPVSIASNGVSWGVTQTHAQNPNANALRWGSMYTFSFDADVEGGSVTLGLWKPGTPASMTIAASWQTNGAAASLDVDGLDNNPFSGPIVAMKGNNTPGTLGFATNQVGQLWDLFLLTGSATPNAFVTANGQIVNLNFANPTIMALNNFFGAPFPLPALNIPFLTPNVTATLSGQFAIVDPTNLDGFSLSAPIEIHMFPLPVVVVQAQGINSYINNQVGSGFWQVTHNGNSTANITKVVFSFFGAGSGLGTRMFDSDQSGMGGDFTLGTTYRNGSAANTGLDYTVSAPFATSGWIGLNPGGIVNDFATVEFNFVGGLFNNETFAFDVDTDGASTNHSGSAQTGMLVTVHMSDGTVHNGVLGLDPSVANRSFVTF